MKKFLSKILANRIVPRVYSNAEIADKIQFYWMNKLVRRAKDTMFGINHSFKSIKNYEKFKENIPIYSYEDYVHYIGLIKKGEKNILWPGKPKYLCKTSGTTSGSKFIPLTKEALRFQIKSAFNLLLHYIYETGRSDFLNGKLIFLQGSPILKEENGVKIGRLSGIVANHVPLYLRKNRLPSREVNCIDDWERKVEAIIQETIREKMTVFGGIPPWLQMYFERLSEKTGKTVLENFPELELLIYGGVNFEPYREVFCKLLGNHINYVETYPASEGFIAYQDTQNKNGMLLLTNNGIFFEFIPFDEYHNSNRRRLHIGEVELGVNYVLVLNTNAGLWGYCIGDTIQFVSLSPHRIIVTGRIKNFISAFGEHVIRFEIENSLLSAIKKHGGIVSEFTVAPLVAPESGLPHHEWYIEFEELPKDMDGFALELDDSLRSQNSYYDDLIVGSILNKIKVYIVPKGSFVRCMKRLGKLGSQNKVPHVKNDREIANILKEFIV